MNFPIPTTSICLQQKIWKATTILVDRNGNIVGEPMLGGIDNKDNYDALMKQIQSVIDADSTN